MHPPPITQPTVPKRERPEKRPEPEPDFAEEGGPKSSEFATEKDARDITQGEFDRIP
jgi:hypothetical protein